MQRWHRIDAREELWNHMNVSTERKDKSKRKTKVDCEMYTDLWEIWDVSLIYSNLLSSKTNKEKKKKTKEKGGEVGGIKWRKQRIAGSITSCSDSVNINNRNKHENLWTGPPGVGIGQQAILTVIQWYWHMSNEEEWWLMGNEWHVTHL